MSDVSGLLEKLSGVKQRGSDKWEARCPTHDDKRASLSITITSSMILMKCHAGCETKTICGSLGMKVSDLFIKQPNGQASGNGRQPQIVAEYSYHDESGNHLYDVIRYSPKDFRQRRAGGVWKMDGVRRVIYNLPAVMKSEYVFFVEGEKDVESLRKVGLTATMSPGGANAWRAEYSQFFRKDHHVTILPDNDDPGREYAQRVAASLKGKVASVRIIELPNLPTKGDVTDWLRGKDPVEAAEELTRMSEAHEEAEATPKGLEEESLLTISGFSLSVVLSATELNAMEIPEREAVIDGVFRTQLLSMIFAPRGMGKTRLVMHLADAVTRGSRFLAWNVPKPRRVYTSTGNCLPKIYRKSCATSAGRCRPRCWI
jgi:5S rRNA maturation endonuclease (ribonuclease M5)